jgi:hypothetical protein
MEFLRSSHTFLIFSPGNNCIRSIDLESGQVFLLAGRPGTLDATSSTPATSQYLFVEPRYIALRSSYGGYYDYQSGDYYDYQIYVTESFQDEANPFIWGGFHIRIIGVFKEQIQQENSYNKDVPYRGYAPGFACKPSGLAFIDDRWAIVSCSEVNAIHRYDIWGRYSEMIAGSMEPGYLDAFSISARFRFPQGVAVSPDGKWALIAE